MSLLILKNWNKGGNVLSCSGVCGFADGECASSQSQLRLRPLCPFPTRTGANAMSSVPAETRQPPSPPRVVAISGIIFSALYITSLVLVRLAVPADPKEPGIWLADPACRNWVCIALNLVPFTGIAFIWFMAVLRNRIGLLEDRFFATVFLGSGMLFVAMLFVAVAVSRGLLETFAAGRLPPRAKPMLSVGAWRSLS